MSAGSEETGLVPGEHGKHDPADEIEGEVHARALIQAAELLGGVGGEDE